MGRRKRRQRIVDQPARVSWTTHDASGR